jgi:hypothetical protein
VLDLPVDRTQDLRHGLVVAGGAEEPLADTPVNAPCPVVLGAETLLRSAVSHYHELPVLAVGAGGRPQGEFDAAQDDGVIDRVGQHFAYRSLREHHPLERHL